MIKWLLVIGVVTAIYVFFIKKSPSVTKKQNNNKEKDKKLSNEMVQCSTCSVYCELDDALLSGGKYYCSTECLEKA